MTNREKFKEIFAYAPVEREFCSYAKILCKEDAKAENCGDCKYNAKFWDNEYKKPRKEMSLPDALELLYDAADKMDCFDCYHFSNENMCNLKDCIYLTAFYKIEEIVKKEGE